MSKLAYPVEFSVTQVTPDPTAYNQQRQIYQPNSVTVRIDIEINRENFYISNALFEKITLYELGQGDKPRIPDLVFTSLGWKRVMEKLEEPYQEKATIEEDNDEFEDLY
jgi:hypothetical protein